MINTTVTAVRTLTVGCLSYICGDHLVIRQFVSQDAVLLVVLEAPDVLVFTAAFCEGAGWGEGMIRLDGVVYRLG